MSELQTKDRMFLWHWIPLWSFSNTTEYFKRKKVCHVIFLFLFSIAPVYHESVFNPSVLLWLYWSETRFNPDSSYRPVVVLPVGCGSSGGGGGGWGEGLRCSPGCDSCAGVVVVNPPRDFVKQLLPTTGALRGGGGGQLSPLPPPGLVHISSGQGWGATGVGPGGLSGHRMVIKHLPAVLVGVHLNQQEMSQRNNRFYSVYELMVCSGALVTAFIWRCGLKWWCQTVNFCI